MRNAERMRNAECGMRSSGIRPGAPATRPPPLTRCVSALPAIRNHSAFRIPRSALAAAAFYAAVTVALTWPVAAGLTRHIAGDLGDPLFTSWVLAWDATHLGRGLWNA